MNSGDGLGWVGSCVITPRFAGADDLCRYYCPEGGGNLGVIFKLLLMLATGVSSPIIGFRSVRTMELGRLRTRLCCALCVLPIFGCDQIEGAIDGGDWRRTEANVENLASSFEEASLETRGR